MPCGDHVLKRDSAERSAGEDHGARSRSDDAGDGREERGLAGAVRADDADDLAFVDLQVDFADGGDGAVAHDESGDGEKRRARASLQRVGAEIGAANAGIGADFRRCAGCDRPAAVEDVDALAEVHHQGHVVLDHQDAAIVFGPDVDDEVAQLVRFGRREAGRRFVEQKEARIDRERAGKADAPLLAVAESGRGTMRLLGQPSSPRMARARRLASRRPRPCAT